MSLKKCFFLCITCIYIVSCQKAHDITPSPPSPPSLPPAGTDSSLIKNDSLYLLSSISGSFDKGSKYNFEYDDHNRLIKFYRPYPYAYPIPCYVMYKNNIVSHIIAEGYNKVSMVFIYGANGKCAKVYYKYPVNTAISNDSPSFGDITDGKYGEYDSLVYSSTGQVQQIYHLQIEGNGIIPATIIKLYYSNSSDTTLNKLEEYLFDDNGSPVLNDQLLLTTNSIDNPVKKNLWFFPFVYKLSFNTGSDVLTLPILFDDPSTYVDVYAPFASKCIINYKVNNSWGLYNYGSSVFNYKYSADSLHLTVVKQGDVWGLNVNYTFKKVKK